MYLSRRRPGHSQALLEVEESHEDDMRRLWLRRDTRRACVRMRPPTLNDRRVHTHTQHMSRAPERRRTRVHALLSYPSHLCVCPPSQPPSNWPSPDLTPWSSVGLDTWLHGAPPCPQHWPPGRPAHDRQQIPTRASSGCTGKKKECVRMRRPTLDDACAHRLDMPHTKIAEESMRTAHLRQPTPLTSMSVRLHGHHQIGQVGD